MTWHDYLHHSIDILNILTPIVGPLRHQQERFYTRDSSSGITCTCDTRTPTHRVLCPEIEPPALQHILAYPRTLEAIASSTVKSVSSIPVPLVAEPKARKWDSFASSFNPCPLETIANWNASTTFKYQCGCFQRGKPQLTSFKHSRQQIARRSIPVFFLRKIIYLPQSSWYTKMFPPLVCLYPQSLDPRRSQVDNCSLYWRVVFLILGNSFLLFSHLGVRFIWKRWAGHRWKWLQLGGWVEDEG